MIMQTVASSNIDAIGYEKGTMHIRFHSGSTYAYYNVPANLYNDLMKAASHGKYFHANIKGKYGDTKIS